MKNKLFKLSGLILIVFFVFGCGDGKQTKTTFVPQEVVIPESLKDNPEAVEYLTAMSYAVDEFAFSVEEMLIELNKMGVKEGDELSTMQKFKALKIMASYSVSVGEFIITFGELEEKSHLISDGLSDEEEEAFGQLYLRFEKRMKEVEEKYDKISNVQ